MPDPLLVVALLIVIAIDVRAWTSVDYLWRLYREDRTTPPIPTTRLTLTLVKAVVATLTTAGTTYLIGITGTRVLAQAGIISIDYAGIAMALSPVTLAVFVLILAAPIISAEYLRWRRRQVSGRLTIREFGGSGVEGTDLPADGDDEDASGQGGEPPEGVGVEIDSVAAPTGAPVVEPDAHALPGADRDDRAAPMRAQSAT